MNKSSKYQMCRLYRNKVKRGWKWNISTCSRNVPWTWKKGRRLIIFLEFSQIFWHLLINYSCQQNGWNKYKFEMVRCEDFLILVELTWNDPIPWWLKYRKKIFLFSRMCIYPVFLSIISWIRIYNFFACRMNLNDSALSVGMGCGRTRHFAAQFSAEVLPNLLIVT